MFITIFVLTVSVVTAGAALVMGRALLHRSRPLAIMACGLVVPMLLVLVALIQIGTAPRLPSPNDGPAMVFVGLLLLALLSLPIAVATSTLTRVMWTRRNRAKA
jgi:hypothetical protein